MEARVGELLGYAHRFLPRRRQLAITCALEHFTALMVSVEGGRQVLSGGAVTGSTRQHDAGRPVL